MHSPEILEKMLFDAFPQQVVTGVIAPHDCEECLALRQQLSGISWLDVPSEFILANDNALPLLSPEAYVAFLPAWLRVGLRNPDSEVAKMLAVNLGSPESPHNFSRRQAHVIVEVARFMVPHNFFGPNDPVTIDSLAEIERVWSRTAA